METEEKYLVPVQPTTLQTVQVIQSLAPIVQASRMFGITQEQAAIVMLMAHDLGFGYGPALNGLLYCIDTKNGKKVGLSSAAIHTLIMRSGLTTGIKITDLEDAKGNPVGCSVYMKRVDGRAEYTATFTQADAERAGLLSKDNWRNYPRDMYFSRALAICGRRVCPEPLAGMYPIEELGAVVNSDGEPVTVDAVATPCPAPEAAASDVAPILQELVTRYGAEAVMGANDGRIPATDAELIAIATKLGAADGSS